MLSLKGPSRPQRITFALEGDGARHSLDGSETIERNALSIGPGFSAANLAPIVAVSFAFDAMR